MPAYTPAQLASEINNDPAAIGYAPKVAAKDDSGVVALLNTLTATTIFRNDITIHEIIAAIPAADFATLTVLQIAKLQVLFAGTSTLDATNPNTRQIILGIFTGLPNTITALTALASRPGTRAEVLWGINTVPGQADVSFALRGAR